MKIFSTEKFKENCKNPHEKHLLSKWCEQMEGKEAIKENGEDFYTVYLTDESYIYPIYEYMLIDGPEQLIFNISESEEMNV